MAWPLTMLRTYVPNSLPAIAADDLNALQQAVNSIQGATWGIKSIYIDGLGDGTARSPAKGRLYVAGGTALVAGDFTLGAGWGVGAAIAAISGTDARGSVSITAAGAPAPGPVTTITFKDLTWTSTPVPLVFFSNASDILSVDGGAWVTAVSATAWDFTFKNYTPLAGQSYAFTWLMIG